MQVDAARQDAREATKRAAGTEAKLEEARALERTLREQITRLDVAHQHAVAQLQAAGKTIEGLQVELAQAREQVAERDRPTSESTSRPEERK